MTSPLSDNEQKINSLFYSSARASHIRIAYKRFIEIGPGTILKLEGGGAKVKHLQHDASEQ